MHFYKKWYNQDSSIQFYKFTIVNITLNINIVILLQNITLFGKAPSTFGIFITIIY